MSDSSPQPPPPPMTAPGPDEDRGTQLCVAYVVTCVISLIFIALRFWARMSIRAIGADDWCMLITALCYIACTVTTSILALNGGTRHLFYLSQNIEKTIYVTRLNWIGQTFGIACLVIGKISISLLILRLLDRVSRVRRWSLYFASFLMAIIGIVMISVNFGQCRDANALWDPAVKASTKCWEPSVQSTIAIVGASLNTAMDFLLVIVPITIVWSVQLSLRDKIGLGLLLGCGIITGIISAIKTSHLGSLSERSDLTWETYILYIFTGVEIASVIVLGSLPTLRPLYNLLTGRGSGTKISGYYANSYGKSGMSSGHSRPGYKSMDSETSHPLQDLSIDAVQITRTFKATSNAASKISSRRASLDLS